jgi:hypothetical protein
LRKTQDPTRTPSFLRTLVPHDSSNTNLQINNIPSPPPPSQIQTYHLSLLTPPPPPSQLHPPSKKIRVKDIKIFEDEKRVAHIPKKMIFEEVLRHGVKLSIASFYIIAQKLKKPRRRTDCCEVCKRGRYLIKKKEIFEKEAEKLENKQLLSPHLLQLQLSKDEEDEMTAYVCHAFLHKQSRKSIEFKETNLREGEGIMIFDYKECWNTRSFINDETSWDHWHPNGISHIAYVLIWKEKGEKHKRIYNYLSECRKHDTKFTTQTMKMATKEQEMKSVSKLYLFCDVGPHFYNKYILYQIFSTSLFSEKKISLTFFAEHHGKSLCDSAFGVLSRAVRERLPLPQVQSCKDLVGFFNSIKEEDSECCKKIKEEHIFREYEIHNFIFNIYNNYIYIYIWLSLCCSYLVKFFLSTHIDIYLQMIMNINSY